MCKLRYPVLWTLASLLVLALVSATVALDPPQNITRHVVGSAGQKVAAGPFILDGTLGEPVAGPFVAGGGYRLASGYWKGATHDTQLFLPVILK